MIQRIIQSFFGRLIFFWMIFGGAHVHGGEWHVVFFDGFDGATLERNRWATRYIYNDETLDHLNDEKQRYRDNNNHIVENGLLHLVARYVGDGLFESGMIRSRQTFRYGYFEARVFFPKGNGIWPAFWLNSDYDENGKLAWPPEIDIFEYVVNGREDKANMLHSSVTERGQPRFPEFTYASSDFNLRWKSLVSNSPLNEAWHIAGLLWEEDSVTFFWDGRKIYSRKYAWVRANGELAPPAHILINFAVGGKWAGRHGVDIDAFPQSFKIDYVKVCQFKGDVGGASSDFYNSTPCLGKE